MSHIRILPSYFHSPPPAPPYVPEVQVFNRTLFDYDDIQANAWIRFSTTGDCNGNFQLINQDYVWLLTGSASSYDIRYVKTGGDASASLSGGMANNTWYNLNTNRTMALLNSVELSYLTFIGTVAIKYNANSTIIASNTVTWYSDTDV